MDTTILGRTGLRVGVAGLGTGGNSRLGQSTGATEAQSVAIVQRALDLGVMLIDTATVYDTEEIVGKAIKSRRDQVVLSTKSLIVKKGLFRWRRITASELEQAINMSLKKLETDYIDIYNLHGVRANQLDYAKKVLLPVMIKAREQGKIRFLGITEMFSADPAHEMLDAALQDDFWDVVMVGFNLLNPSARKSVLAKARKKNIGVQAMYAVRKALIDVAALKAALNTPEASAQIDLTKLDPIDPLGFLAPHASNLPDAAYRFCRHEPGIHVVLTGTGQEKHLEENVRAINAGALPPDVCAHLAELFGNVTTITGE